MFCGRHTVAMGDGDRPHHPLLVLKLFSGEGNFDDWISHFETVASNNGWDNAAKFQWMSVRMTGGHRPPSVDFWNQREEVIVQLSQASTARMF